MMVKVQWVFHLIQINQVLILNYIINLKLIMIIYQKIRIISNLCVCSDNKCDNICGIDVEPEPIQEVYRELSVSKPIRHMNQDVTCQLKRGQYWAKVNIRQFGIVVQ